uniref:G-protein coupled receptors family 1 profile domain-containing protein n=1 Tax=Acrobeloides nanus TaxID=290746 RepID=A0A914DVE2_9BILA
MFFTIVTPGAGWISLVICIDRLICVFLPIKYLKLTSRYAYIIMFSAIACTIPTFILSGLASYEVRDAYTVML